MVVFLTGAIALGVTFLFGCVGEILTEKAGHLNLGIPGIMSVGAMGGCLGVSLYMGALSDPNNASYILLLLIGILSSAFFAGIMGLIYAFLTISMRANQNVTGLILTIFGTGLTEFVMEAKVDRSLLAKASTYFTQSLPFAGKLGWFGEIFLSHGILVYIAIAIAIVAAWLLQKTRIGLSLRAVGENPATADAAGINVTAYKYAFTLIGAAVAGMGGLYYIMDYLKGSWEYGIDSLGWLAIALVIFTLWRPDLSILGSFVFGALYIASYSIMGISFAQMQLLKMLPYVVTVIVLIVTSIVGKKETQPPASLGLSYFREDR